MIYLSAGHFDKDPGAIANGQQENNLTMQLRDLIAIHLKAKGASFTLDRDSESLGAYLQRIKPGSGSVVCELHFDAAAPTATGISAFIRDGAEQGHSAALAADIVTSCAVIMGINRRGVFTESKSHRGKLGLLRTAAAGISVLVEMCFITNKNDLQAYFQHKQQLAECIAELLIKYDSIQS